MPITINIKDKLKGKIVLISDAREVKAEFEPMGNRRTDEELAKMAECCRSGSIASAAITCRKSRQRMKMIMDGCAESRNA